MSAERRVIGWAGVLVAAWLVYQSVTMTPGTRALWSLAWQNAAAGRIGVGIPGANGFDFSTAALEPGDIILGHNPGNSWGYWTHAALYVGDGMVVDTLLRYGVHLERVDRFAHAYQRAGVLKISATPAEKAQAVRVARSLLGHPFNLLSGRHQAGWTYCTKVAWYAYDQAGVDIDPGGGNWVVPDNFVRGPRAASLTASEP